jgi:hypothetical protein
MSDWRTLDTASQDFLHNLQSASFGYFLDYANPENGLIADKTTPDSPCSIAAVGMALTAYPIAVERGFLSRMDAVTRVLKTLSFLADGEQSQSPNASGYRGFFYHFLDMNSGRRAWNCELSSLDTAILMAGILTAREYFKGESSDEAGIRSRAESLYLRVDWNWMRADNDAICLGWTPERGFKRWHYKGYSEALILYLLALGSPSFPVPPSSYDAWLSTYRWRRIYGVDYLHAGPLFIHQLSHIWVDFRGIRDRFMRARDCDYFENSRRATLVQQAYAIRNPRGLAGYGEFCWGITACDGPGRAMQTQNGRRRMFFDYTARGAPYGPDDGTIAPWAAAASLPFAPEIVLPTLAHFDHMGTCNATFTDDPSAKKGGSAPQKSGWTSPHRFGIHEGPTVMMIENYRSGLIWSSMRDCAIMNEGLLRADFRAA